jgi:hypothetical protein
MSHTRWTPIDVRARRSFGERWKELDLIQANQIDDNPNRCHLVYQEQFFGEGAHFGEQLQGSEAD